MHEEAKNNITTTAGPAASDEKKVIREGDTGDENTHAFMVLGTRFEIEKRYEVIDPIGSGAYGVVVAARDNDV